jgi:hypothetical protein
MEVTMAMTGSNGIRVDAIRNQAEATRAESQWVGTRQCRR